MEEDLPEMSGLYHPYVPVSGSADIQNTHVASVGLPSLFRIPLIYAPVSPAAYNTHLYTPSKPAQ